MVAKFRDQDDLIKIANDTLYGLAAAVFSQDITKAITTANALQAGTVWINQHSIVEKQVPFGGYKRGCCFPCLLNRKALLLIAGSFQFGSWIVESGIGRELGEYAIDNYTEIKAVHVNLTMPPPI